jgi:Transposase IS66 family/IS66 C-terminal element
VLFNGTANPHSEESEYVEVDRRATPPPVDQHLHGGWGHRTGPVWDNSGRRGATGRCFTDHEFISVVPAHSPSRRLRAEHWLCRCRSVRWTCCHLNRWKALGRFLEDGKGSIDNNHCENLFRPWAMGRKAWLFCGSKFAGHPAAVVMSLVHSAKLHGHDSWVYLKEVLERLSRLPNHRIDELLPHRWSATTV